MSQDGSRVWAIDQPNIVQPPPGWDREVLHFSIWEKVEVPLVEIGRYLADNPHYIQEGVTQFSFATPKPLQEGYVQKRTFGGGHELSELPEVAQVDPLYWAAPPTRRELLGGPGSSTSDPADINQSEMSGHVKLHQPELSEPSAQHCKRTVKQVPSRKCRRTPPAELFI